MSEHNAAIAAQSGHGYARQTGWRGVIVFAGTMMILLGSFHVMAGLVALFEEDYYLVTRSGLLVDLDFTAWGWAHLILGLVVALGGVAVMSGKLWGQVVAVAVAMLSAIVNLAFMSAYPLWSVIMIALDVLVIYAVTAHGDR
jgi:hypothetical protein